MHHDGDAVLEARLELLVEKLLVDEIWQFHLDIHKFHFVSFERCSAILIECILATSGPWARSIRILKLEFEDLRHEAGSIVLDHCGVSIGMNTKYLRPICRWQLAQMSNVMLTRSLARYTVLCELTFRISQACQVERNACYPGPMNDTLQELLSNQLILVICDFTPIDRGGNQIPDQPELITYPGCVWFWILVFERFHHR